MRSFVRDILLFVLLLALTLACGEWLLRGVPNTYRYKDGWMRRHGRETTVLVLGNSLTLEGVNPALLGSGAFNLANSAQLPEHDRFLLERYAPYDSLRIVVMGLGENLLNDELERVSSLSVRCAYYQIYMGYDKHSWCSAHNFELARLDVALAKWRAWRQLRARGRALACDSLGFAPELQAERSPGWQRRGLEAGWSGDSLPVGNMRRSMAHLAAMARFCDARGIRLVLVSMPLWVKSPPGAEARYRAVGRWLRDDFGATYLDYTRDGRFGEDDFFDGHHLNDHGADKFTVTLRDTLRTAIQTPASRGVM